MTPDAATLTWGERVRYERERRGWSQQHLAGLAGCSAAAISRLELGARRTPDHVRVRVAKALGMNPARLFPYEDAPPALSTRARTRRGVRHRPAA